MRKFSISRLCLFAAALAVAIPSMARAEWEASVKSIGFGERAAVASIRGEGSGLAFMCESSAKPMALKITTSTRVESYEPSWRGTLQLSIDSGEAHDFEATVGQSQARTRLVTAELDAEQAKKVAELLSSAKRTIAFRIVGPSGATAYSSVVGVSGSRRTIARVLEACTAPTTAPARAAPPVVGQPASQNPPQQEGVTQTVAPGEPAKPVAVPSSASVAPAAPVVPVAPRDVADLAELTLTPELMGKVVRITVGCMSGSNGVLLRDKTGGLVPVVDTALSTEDKIAMRRHCSDFRHKIEVIGTLQKPSGRVTFYKHEVRASAVSYKPE